MCTFVVIARYTVVKTILSFKYQYEFRVNTIVFWCYVVPLTKLNVSFAEIKTTDIYKGVIPFVIIQLSFLIYLFFNPEFIYLIPEFLENYNS